MTITQATTQSGVVAQNIDAAPLATTEDGAAAFLSKWSEEDPLPVSEDPEENEESNEPAEEQAEDEADEAVEDTEDSDEDHPEDSEESTDEDDEEDESEETPKKVLEDDSIVKIKVDGKELDVSVKDLKRLYGQEAVLTRKSQEAAAKRKEAEAVTMKTQATLDKMYTKAVERWKPYSEVDMLLASKQLDDESFAALRKEAQAAYEDFRFISEEADTFVKNSQAQQQQQLQEAAKESVKVLKETIPNWSPQLYDQIREYAIGQGLVPEVVNNLVDPAALMFIHKARLYDEAKKVVTKKKVLQPKKVLKPTVTSTAKDMGANSVSKARGQLANSGSVDDATNLFLSRWAQD